MTIVDETDFGRVYRSTLKPFTHAACAAGTSCVVLAQAHAGRGGDVEEVAEFTQSLATNIAARWEGDTRRAVAEGLEDGGVCDLDPYLSLGVLSWDDIGFSFAAIGGVELVALVDGHAVRLGDAAFASAQAQVLRAVDEGFDADDQDPYAGARELVGKYRDEVNTEEGLWLATSATGHVAVKIVENMFYFDIPRQHVTDIAILSSGSADIADTFKVCDFQTLISSAKEGSLSSLIFEAEMRADTDKSRMKYPRLHHFADVTLAYVDPCLAPK